MRLTQVNYLQLCSRGWPKLFTRCSITGSGPDLIVLIHIPMIIFVSLLWMYSNRPLFLLHWGLHSWMWYSRWGLSTEQRGRIISLKLLTILLLMQPGYSWLSGLWGHITGSCSVSQPPVPPSPFLTGLCSVLSSPSLYWQRGLPWSRSKTIYLLNLVRFFWDCCSSLSRSFWLASCPLSVLTTPHVWTHGCSGSSGQHTPDIRPQSDGCCFPSPLLLKQLFEGCMTSSYQRRPRQKVVE